ncbi:hypothetical protein IOC61_04145 [Halomonas sp. KAO]|nr:hypothetical protein [Halomonas sp. KAO]MBF7052506.1 hypothetical protein [Halomonas sp. KAO]
MMVDPLGAAQVFQACPEKGFGFEISSELAPLDLLARNTVPIVVLP